MKEVDLTNMIMLYTEDNKILVLDRIENDWPGITFPGGHVEDNETLEEAAIREFKEETGLDIFNLENCGYFEWNNMGKKRYVTILYRTKDYKGKIKSGDEGRVFFLDLKDLNKYKLSNDFDLLLDRMLKK